MAGFLASSTWKSLTSSWTSRRPFHSLIDGWKASEQTASPGSSSCHRSAMFQAIALTIASPCANRSWTWFFRSPTTRGSPTTRTRFGHQERPRVADPVRLERLDLLDDLGREHPEQDLGVDREHLLPSARR